MNFKKKPFGFMDMLAFKNKVPKRRKHIKRASGEAIPTNFAINSLAAEIHYPQREFFIAEIKKHNADTKTFIIKPSDQKKLPGFIPGSYVRLKFDNPKCYASAPFSIASSPLDAHNDGFYAFTIKRNPNGVFTNYILDHAMVNDTLWCTSPYGTFNINPLRDYPTIVGIAGGTGITPFVSMAKAIAEGSLKDVDLYIFYGVKTVADAIWYEEIKQWAAANDHLHIILVAEQPKDNKVEKGFITRALVDKYVPHNKYTVLACGPNGLYAAISKQFNDFIIKDLRTEANIIPPRSVKNVTTYELTVHQLNNTYHVKAKNTETILMALQKAKISAPSRCMSGKCGFCHAKCVKGKYTPAVEHRRLADITYHYIHPCCTYPDSNMEIIINPDK